MSFSITKERPVIGAMCIVALAMALAVTLAVMLVIPPVMVAGQERPRAAALPPDRDKHALIIGGISGEEDYAKRFGEWKERLRAQLAGRLGFAEDQITVLTEKPGPNETRSSAEEVRQALVRLRNSVRPGQQLFIFLIGHGSFDGKVARFNLPGPDMTAEEYAALIDPIPSSRTVVVNLSSASGEFIKPLSRGGRIIVTATRSGMEQNAPKFAEHFIRALETAEADLDKNGRISILEAFRYGTRLTATLYEQSGRLATEHALLDDNGDGVGHGGEEAGDGGLANLTYLDSLPRQQAGGDPALAALYEERMRMEGAIEQLRSRKAGMKPEEYQASLETMLIDLARLSRSIRTSRKTGGKQ